MAKRSETAAFVKRYEENERYKPQSKGVWGADPSFDPKRCAKRLPNGYRSRQCVRKPITNSEWCAQHDPYNIYERRQKERKRMAEEIAIAARMQKEREQRNKEKILREATLEELQAEIERRCSK